MAKRPCQPGCLNNYSSGGGRVLNPWKGDTVTEIGYANFLEFVVCGLRRMRGVSVPEFWDTVTGGLSREKHDRAGWETHRYSIYGGTAVKNGEWKSGGEAPPLKLSLCYLFSSFSLCRGDMHAILVSYNAQMSSNAIWYHVLHLS